MGIRVSENFLHRTLLGAMQRNLGDVLRLQRINSTMRRINSYADDPRGVGAVQRYDSLLAINAQYLKNIDRARTIVDATDAALQDVADILRDLRVVGLRETSAVATAESNAHAAGEVENLLGRLLGALNGTVEGNYIFGGFRTDLVPFIQVGGSVRYQGDAGEIQAQIGPRAVFVPNLPGASLLGAGRSLLRGLVDVAPRLAADTPLTELNRGQGWSPGVVVVSDGAGGTHTIDLRAAVTVGEVLARFASDSGGALSATIAADGSGLVVSGSGPLAVSEQGGDTTALSLGLLGGSPDGVLAGGDIRAAPSAATPLAAIASLEGALPLGTIVVIHGGADTVVDLAGASTLGDLEAAIAGALPGFTLRLDGGVLTLVGDGTSAFTVREDGGGTAAALGLLGTGTPARLFGVFEEMRDALLAGDRDAVRALFAELGQVEQSVLGLLVKVGGRESMLEWTDGVLRQRATQLQSNRARERDADLIEAASELAKAEAAYQASLMAAARAFQVNLISYLR